MLIKIQILIVSVAISVFYLPTPEHLGKCSTIIHIGDSTSVSMKNYLPSAYKRNGFKSVVSAGNGRSILHRSPPDTMSGIEAVQYWKAHTDKRACFVIALGTNDAAWGNLATDKKAISAMQGEVRGYRVMWVNVWMDSRPRPSYSISASTRWNRVLSQSVKNYGNQFVFDWAAVAKNHPEWFVSDGFHYTSIGSKKRAENIASATKRFFSN